MPAKGTTGAAIAIVIGAVVSFIAVYIVLPLAAIAVAIHFIRRFW